MSLKADAKLALFAAEYRVDHNGTRAAIAAGYAAPSAHVTASRLLKNPKVTALIVAKDAKQLAAVDASAERIVREAARIAFGDIRDVVTWDGERVTLRDSSELTAAQAALVKEVRINRTTTRQKDGSEQEHEVREVKVWDKLAALTLLARLHPEFSEKHEVKAEVDVVERRYIGVEVRNV